MGHPHDPSENPWPGCELPAVPAPGAEWMCLDCGRRYLAMSAAGGDAVTFTWESHPEQQSSSR